MQKSRVTLKIANLENDKIQEFYLPVEEETLEQEIGIESYTDKNLTMLEVGRGGGKRVQQLLNSCIQRKNIDIKQLNEIGKIFSEYDKIEPFITINAFIEIGKIKKWQDIMKVNKELNKYQVIFYGSELEKERLGIYIYNSFQHKKPVYERNKEYREKLVDDFYKYSKGHFTEYGYLVKDFDKIKAKCTNKGFEIIDKIKSKGDVYEEEG